jgi:ATP-dependent protease HslVU (ClpYQ) peptidase subunit
MNINVAILASLMGVLGVIVGASLQYFFNKRVELVKQNQSMKIAAYVDFIKAVAGITLSQRHQDKEKELEFTILLADAKARIAIYGTKEVTEEMANFFQLHGALISPEALTSFTRLVQTMRQQTIGSSEAGMENAIQHVLFS